MVKRDFFFSFLGVSDALITDVPALSLLTCSASPVAKACGASIARQSENRSFFVFISLYLLLIFNYRKGIALPGVPQYLLLGKKKMLNTYM
jgi:hypothetical protein